MTVKLNRVRTGWYASKDGRWAVVAEGSGYVSAEGRSEGFGSDGWALCFDRNGGLRDDHQSGETLEWFDTKREAVGRLEAFVARMDERG